MKREKQKKEEKVFTPTTELMSENSKEYFPLASDVGQATLWLVMPIVTLAGIVGSQGTNRLKRAHDAYLNPNSLIDPGVEVQIWYK